MLLQVGGKYRQFSYHPRDKNGHLFFLLTYLADLFQFHQPGRTWHLKTNQEKALLKNYFGTNTQHSFLPDESDQK